ncbi:Rho GTPase-activating protein 8, partial [Larimichthys crocea]
YLKFTLDQYVEMDYILVYFHHGLRSSNKPSLKWLREAYGEFDRNHKFGKKLTYVNYLAELRAHLNYEQLLVPADVLRQEVRQEVVSFIVWSRPTDTTRSYEPLGQTELLRLRTEGIFRRSARVQLIKDVQKLYNLVLEGSVAPSVVAALISSLSFFFENFEKLHSLGNPVNFDEYADVHVPAVILKTFLRELPEPLLTFRVYSQVQEILNVESSLRVSRCKQIVESLPEHHFIVTKFLLGFLHTVSQESIVNKMSPSNLACVFGVNLVWPRHGSISLSALTPINIFTEILIEHFHIVFGSRCPPAQVLP